MGARYSLKNLTSFLKARYAPRGAHQSFSQYGEDLLIKYILGKEGIKEVFYVDIGAHQPVFGNNTYLFYQNHGRGVLVEPNPAMCGLIAKQRPRDTCVCAGAGGADSHADFYAFSQSTRSTFSAVQAKEWEKSSGQKPKIEKCRIISLDTIVKDYCQGKVPDLVSIDAEGLDLEILQGFSWSVRPKVFCIESTDSINKYMGERDYVLKAQILQNAIFVDKSLKKI